MVLVRVAAVLSANQSHIRTPTMTVKQDRTYRSHQQGSVSPRSCVCVCACASCHLAAFITFIEVQCRIGREATATLDRIKLLNHQFFKNDWRTSSVLGDGRLEIVLAVEARFQSGRRNGELQQYAADRWSTAVYTYRAESEHKQARQSAGLELHRGMAASLGKITSRIRHSKSPRDSHTLLVVQDYTIWLLGPNDEPRSPSFGAVDLQRAQTSLVVLQRKLQERQGNHGRRSSHLTSVFFAAFFGLSSSLSSEDPINAASAP